jgi:tetratricopeptide (TPR) repeat protein
VQHKLIDARTVLGLYYIQMNYHVEAKEAVDPIVNLALRHNYKRRISQIYTIIGAYKLMTEDDFPNASKFLADAFKIAEELNDVLCLVMSEFWLGHCLSRYCEYEKALYYYDKVLQINTAANVPCGVSIIKSVTSIFVYDFQGKIGLGYQTSDEALQIAEENGDIFSKAWAYLARGLSCYFKGSLDEAEGHLLKGRDLSERISLFSVNALADEILRDMYFEIGEFQKSKDHCQKAVYVGEHQRFNLSFINLNKIGVTRAKVMIDNEGIDLKVLYGYQQ